MEQVLPSGHLGMGPLGSHRREEPPGHTAVEQWAMKAGGLHELVLVARWEMQQACEPGQFESLAQSSSVEHGEQLPSVQLLPVGELTEVQHIWGRVHDWLAQENEVLSGCASLGASETAASGPDPESGGGVEDCESADASASTNGSPAQAEISHMAPAPTQRPNLLAIRLSSTIANLQRPLIFGEVRRPRVRPSSRARELRPGSSRPFR